MCVALNLINLVFPGTYLLPEGTQNPGASGPHQHQAGEANAGPKVDDAPVLHVRLKIQVHRLEEAAIGNDGINPSGIPERKPPVAYGFSSFPEHQIGNVVE